MSALDNALSVIVIERYDGFASYLSCCGNSSEFGKVEHIPGCSVVLAREEVAELRRLVALLTTEPLHITRADIDSAKRILQKAEE